MIASGNSLAARRRPAAARGVVREVYANNAPALARPHPLGGWCVAILEAPGVSSCRVYRGHFSSQRAAAAEARRISEGAGRG